MDLTKYLHRQLKADAYDGVDIANIYVDEVRQSAAWAPSGSTIVCYSTERCWHGVAAL